MTKRSEEDCSSQVTRRDLFKYGARGAGAVVLVGPMASLLAACSNDGDNGGAANGSASPTFSAGVTAAEIQSATGTVKVLGWQWYQVPEEDPPGVTAEWGYLAANEDTITKTQQPGSYDIVTIFQGQIDQLLAVDRIVPIDVSLIPNFSRLDQMFQDTEVIRRNGQVYGVPFQWGYAYQVYDARQMSVPTSFSDLTSPSLEGKVGVPDDPYAVITSFAALIGIPKPNQMTPDEFQQVQDAMDEFKPQLRTIYTYGEAPQLLGRQDIAIAFPEFGPTVIAAKDAGADAKMNLLSAWSYVDCLMIIKSTASLAATYKWIDTAIADPAQLALAKSSGAFPAVDAAVKGLPDELQYSNPSEVLTQAPLLPGPPVDTSQGYVPFQQWLSFWNVYKS
jgi:spermidine/putrescine-binding protein